MKKLIYLGSKHVSVLDKRKNRTVYDINENTKINLNGEELKDLSLAKAGWNVDMVFDEKNVDLVTVLNIITKDSNLLKD
jgi:hypothetical protein